MLLAGLCEIEVREQSGGGLLVELAGEFDESNFTRLRDALQGIAASRRTTVVDLSRVTFLDLGATRELAACSQLHGRHVTFIDPSAEVLGSVAACCLEDWMRFGPLPRTPKATDYSPGYGVSG